MKAQPPCLQQDSNGQARRAAVLRDERGRRLEVDMLRAGDDQSVLELVAVLEQPSQAPRPMVELLGAQRLVRVKRLEDGEADFPVVELGWKRHGKRLLGRSARLLDPPRRSLLPWRPGWRASASSSRVPRVGSEAPARGSSSTRAAVLCSTTTRGESAPRR